jgi:hypothetical protein
MSSEQSILNRLRVFATEHGIRRAWFTTFVFDVSFFERHVLPILLVAELPAMSQDLEPLNEQLEGDSVDVRVFHDFRGTYQTGRPKQTTFSMHAVLPGYVADDCAHGVFHPKVAWFETKAGEWFVMAGSANLTYGGYARNRESVVLARVETAEQVADLRSFFRGFHGGELPESPMLEGEGTWRLCYTGAEEKFGDVMGWGSSDLAWMAVWSPYFSKRMAEGIRDRMALIQELILVPDLSNQGKIRLDGESVEALLAMERVQFHQRMVNEGEHALTHAKLWLTPNRLAVGSWNFTDSALGWASKGHNNVEAGLVFTLSEVEAHQIRESAALYPRNPAVSTDPDEHVDEDMQSLPRYALVAEIELDWRIRTMRLTRILPKRWEHDEALEFELPGGERVTRVALQDGIPLGARNRTPVLNRQFHVYREGKLLFSGYLLETGLELRPTRRFDNLNHMFQAWLTRDPSSRTDLVRPISTPRHVDAVTGEWLPVLAEHGHHKWFSTFLALAYMKQEVDALKAENPAECLRLGYQQPGSVLELRDLVSTELLTGVYAWLVTQRTNVIIHAFNEKVEATHQLEAIPLPEQPQPDGVAAGAWRRWLVEIEQLMS